MKYRLAFVGIDRFSDPQIRELSGAANDAKALWGLFADTLPDADAHLLADEEGTATAVRAAFSRALLDATEEDVALIFFAGHGTRDHRLVVHDTNRLALSNTTIPMEELAELFKKTKARVAILILDCCFSGGVTARVLDDSPLSRDFHDPLLDIAGRGRVIITASSLDEPAYELPGHDHGLLTKALLDAFGEQEHTSVLTLVNAVMGRIRAEAARMGIEQTPVFLGEVQGGIVLPRLRRGPNYNRFFPDESTVKVGPSVQELSVFQIPAVILSEWEGRFPQLNDVQLTAVNKFDVLTGKSLLVIAPTSAGKTFIGEMCAAKAISRGQKAVFLLPYRALVNEKYDQFRRIYGEGAGLRVIRCTGDYADQVESFVRGKYDLGLLTYEMFLNLAVALPHTITQLGLVVIDEAQFITDPGRGITVELLLTYLLAARERGIDPQLIALSAVIGNANRFNEWLGVEILRTERRPVPLTEGVVDRSGTFHLVESGRRRTEEILPPYQIRQRHEKPGAQDVLVPLVSKLLQQGQKILIFRNVRGKTEGCAQYLARDLALPAVSTALDQLPLHDASTSSAGLRRSLQGGTAFHNSNLTSDEKEIVERTFRDPDSGLRVLVATTTVAAGINTPTSTVIIAEQEFLGEDGREFTVAEYKNMAGRAGRLGFNEKGTSMILSETPTDTENLLARYVLGSPESLVSSFHPGQLDTWLLRLLAQPQLRSLPRSEVSRLLAATYGGFLAASINPNWRAAMVANVENLLNEMLRLGLVEQENVCVRLTPLGKACGNSPLAFRSALRLIDAVRSTHTTSISARDLLALVQLLQEADAAYTPMYKKGIKEAICARHAAQRFGDATITFLQRYAGDHFTYWARCKRAAVLSDWVAGEPVELIEQRYTANSFQGKLSRGDITRFADATRWCLRSVHQIVALIYPTRAPTETDIDELCRSLEVGLPVDSLDLLRLSERLSRGEYLALRSAGTRTCAHVVAASKQLIEELLGAKKAAAITSGEKAASAANTA